MDIKEIKKESFDEGFNKHMKEVIAGRDMKIDLLKKKIKIKKIEHIVSRKRNG